MQSKHPKPNAVFFQFWAGDRFHFGYHHFECRRPHFKRRRRHWKWGRRRFEWAPTQNVDAPTLNVDVDVLSGGVDILSGAHCKCQRSWLNAVRSRWGGRVMTIRNFLLCSLSINSPKYESYFFDMGMFINRIQYVRHQTKPKCKQMELN